VDLHRKSNGKWELRWREGSRRRSRTFDRKKDAEDFEADRRRRRQLGQAAVPDDVPLREFSKTYWRLHAIPNLAPSTRDFYLRTLSNHIVPRLGDYGVRELTPNLRDSPHIFLPQEVEEVRSRLTSLRDRTLVSVLAYSGPRPEEVVCRLAWDDVGDRTIRYRGTKKGGKVRFTPLLEPLADDLREWFLASGRPDARAPVFPSRYGEFWGRALWANWRRRVWQGEPERRYDRGGRKATVGCAPAGTRPRDLRSSFITLQIYGGVPLTTIAKQCGTGVTMIEKHYAGVIENWDGEQIPAVRQIMAARQQVRLRNAG
jgi:integrase